eukprot:1185808-Prorocentrum_minimum.AAC.4
MTPSVDKGTCDGKNKMASFSPFTGPPVPVTARMRTTPQRPVFYRLGSPTQELRLSSPPAADATTPTATIRPVAPAFLNRLCQHCRHVELCYRACTSVLALMHYCPTALLHYLLTSLLYHSQTLLGILSGGNLVCAFGFDRRHNNVLRNKHPLFTLGTIRVEARGRLPPTV